MAEITSLREAVAGLVRDGDTVALEGFTHLIPTLAGHEIILQERRDLTLVRMTPDLVYDQMIGMGVASKLVFSWGGNPASVPCTGSETPSRTAGPVPGDRRAQPRRDGEPVRRGRLAPPVRSAPWLPGQRPDSRERDDQQRDMSVQRGAAGSGRRDQPRRDREFNAAVLAHLDRHP